MHIVVYDEHLRQALYGDSLSRARQPVLPFAPGPAARAVLRAPTPRAGLIFRMFEPLFQMYGHIYIYICIYIYRRSSFMLSI